MSNQVRIIGGKFRGKKLNFPDAPGLRPTSDRIRETLFNWLMHDIHDAHCLDAFAGSGALGLEAFSRGAAQVVFIEQEPKVCQQLKQQIQAFQSPQLTLVQQDCCHYLQTTQDCFDIIFLDPPFHSPLLDQCIQILENNSCLKGGGLVYIESPHPPALDTKKWQALKEKKAGQVYYGLYEKSTEIT